MFFASAWEPKTDFSVAENVADWDDMGNPRSTHGRDPADTLPGNELLHRLLKRMRDR